MAKKGTLTVRIIGDERSFKGALNSASDAAGGFAAKLPGILGAAGALGGAALAAGLFEAIDRQAATDKLGAALGLSASEMNAAGRIAGEVWSEAFGDNIGEVNAAIEGVASTLGSFADLGEDRIADLTRDALTIADVFNLDVSEAITAAGVMLNSGLVDDAEEAFDLITRGLQEMPSALRGELLEATIEYGKFFDQLGIDGSEAFALLVEGAELGMYGIDKTGDALGEFTIRAVDMSSTTVEAFDQIGLDAETMAGRILEGGDIAQDAFGEIVDALLAIEDPVDQASAAVALFGEPLNDLGTENIPDFLEALASMEGGMSDVEDATDTLATAAYDNIRTRFTEAWRTAQESFFAIADEEILPKIEEIVDAFEEDGLGGALEKTRELWDESWPRIQRWLEGTVAPALVDFAGTVGGLMAEALWDGFLAGGKSLFSRFLVDPFTDFFDGELPAPMFPEWTRPPLPTPSGEPPGQTATPYTPTRPAQGVGVFHDGGIVPGRPGQEVPILAMAGETVLPTHKTGGAGGVNITNLYVGSRDDADMMGRELKKLAIAGAYGG